MAGVQRHEYYDMLMKTIKVKTVTNSRGNVTDIFHNLEPWLPFDNDFDSTYGSEGLQELADSHANDNAF